MTALVEYEEKLGVKFFDYQRDAFLKAEAMKGAVAPRRCLYYKTGAGKSITALVQLLIFGQREAVVITPPATYGQWYAVAANLGVVIECMSHAKFREPGTKLSRRTAVIADEMHLFGGHNGVGWKKLDTLALHLQAPLIMASATPNYNDAERVYCISHILDPVATKGGFIAFLYKHCITEQNPYSMTPDVTGFHHFANAAEFLAALPQVDYLPDDLVYKIIDRGIPIDVPKEFEVFGLNPRRDRLVASGMEERHTIVDLSMINKLGRLRSAVWKELAPLIRRANGPVLVFAVHSTVAEAAAQTLRVQQVKHGLITGTTSTKKKGEILAAFKDGVLDVLVGTASLATGTDGLDKVCDRLIILDDTDDDAMRRQLVGRIMPRGSDTDASMKRVYRLVLQ